MSDINDIKSLEGKDVFFKPTGNNARGRSGTVYEGKIIKVARVFATFSFDGGYERKYRFEGLHLNDGHNGGYLVFATRKDIDDHDEAIRLANAVSERFRYGSRLQKIDLGKLRKIYDLLGCDPK